MPSSPVVAADADLRKLLSETYALADKASTEGLMPYLQHVVMDCRPDPRPFREKADPWQWTLNKRIAPAIESVARLRVDRYRGRTGIWLTLPKGHDKSSMIGRAVNWALAYCKRQFTGYVAAADREQAGYLAKAMTDEAALNPWLHKRLKIRHWEISGAHNSSIQILAADAASSAGIRGDILICDEVTRWRDRDLFDEIKAGWRKRPHAILIVITNAGLQHTWQHEELCAAKGSKNWYVYEAPGRLASWMDEAAIEDDRRTMPPGMARMLFDNHWVDPADANGYVTRAEAQICADLGSKMGLSYRTQGRPDRTYVAAIDYGPVKDRTVCTVMHLEHFDGRQVAVVDKMDVMQGSRARHVPIADVDAWLDNVRKNFVLDAVSVDPFQLEGTIQKYGGILPIERFEFRSGRGNYELACVLRSAIINKQLAWYTGCGDIPDIRGHPHTLQDELSELLLQSMSYGFRITHLPNKHDDRVFAMGAALMRLLKSTPRRGVYIGEHFW